MILPMLLTTALASSPADDHLARGMTAQKAGDAETAIAAYTDCLQSNPQHVACHWELGWSHWTRQDWDEVIASWERVESLAPDHPDLNKWLTRAREQRTQRKSLLGALADAPATVERRTPKGATLRLRAVGDIMLGTDFPDPPAYLPPDDGAAMLTGVAPLLQDADLTFGNLEGPLCDGGETKKCREGSNCYAFRTPTRYGKYLTDAGFDVMSTANNHSGDFGTLCREQTQATLDRLGIAWSGPPGTIATAKHGEHSIAMVGFHTSGDVNDVNDHEVAAALVRKARAEHDWVIVSFHGGAEGSRATHVPDEMEMFYGERRGHLRKFARAVVGAGADIVIGHGPHVPRGFELIDGHLVAYSLGNFATYGRFNLSGHLSTSLVLEAELDDQGRLVRGRILPTRLEGKGVPAVDEEAKAVALIRSLTEADFGANGPAIARDGTFGPRSDTP